MTIGAALFTIAVGAVLAFAVTAEVAGIDLQIVGYILLAVGALGLVLGLWRNSRRGPAAAPPPGYWARRRDGSAALICAAAPPGAHLAG